MRTILKTALILLLASFPTGARASAACDIDVVLVGATGNLAKKYLWTSLFQLSSKMNLRVYPGSRDAKEKGQVNIDRILAQNVSCGVLKRDMCEKQMERFVSQTVQPYTQLKRSEHYRSLHGTISQNGECASGRLFYLAVPPSAYASIAGSIDTMARPSGSGWLRVIFEKPFGSDFDSAEIMAKDLAASLKEDEIYRIDHYLGKQALQGLPLFMRANKDSLAGVMRSSHVDRIDVAMMETEDCEGRTGFYDKYGVLRDVFQNHLSEMLALTLASDPWSPAERLQALRDVRVPSAADALLGQYASYQSHVDADRTRWNEPTGKRTLTPTCALVNVQSRSAAWSDVPIYLYSGKAAWPSKQGMIRVSFKNGGWMQITLQGKPHGAGKIEYHNVPSSDVDDPTHVPTPSIVLNAPSEDGRWVPIDQGFQVSRKRNAYDVLVEAALEGHAEHFVSTDRLMRAWEIWTPLLRDLSEREPVSYAAGGNVEGVCHPPAFAAARPEIARKEL